MLGEEGGGDLRGRGECPVVAGNMLESGQALRENNVRSNSTFWGLEFAVFAELDQILFFL